MAGERRPRREERSDRQESSLRPFIEHPDDRHRTQPAAAMPSRKVSEARIGALAVTALCLVMIFVAFCAPNWLASDPRYYGAHFVQLGLWETCFRSQTSPDDLGQRKYYSGCRWIFADEYQNLRYFLEPPFFIAVQVFFTLGFINLLLACILLLALLLCCPTGREVFVARLLSCLILASAIFCTIAVITFGARGDGRDWMPDPDHNYLGWAFGLGVVGAFFEYVAAILFWVESRIIYKKRLERQQQVFSLDQAPGKI